MTSTPGRPRPLNAAPVSRSAPQPAARLRLVCFPHAGAAPSVFRPWTRLLAPDIELWSAVLPGRAARSPEPFADDWAALVGEFAEAVAAAVPGPYALFGQSLGAALAYEVARELQHRGKPAVHLIAAASAAPDARELPMVPNGDEALIRHVDRHFAGIPTPVRAVPELLAYFLPGLRADLKLAETYAYRAGPRLTCPVTAFAGDQDSTVPMAGLERWRAHTRADCELHRLSGGHFCLQDHEDEVLAVIRRRLTAGGAR